MIFDDFSLTGKTALVTGGGNGIGSGITKGLAEAGASIACVYRTRPPVEMQRYVEGLGRRFLPIQADVGQMPQLKAIMEQTLNAFGRLDILVNNAGICPRASALEYTEEMWDNIIQVNQKSVFFLSQMAARQFVRQGGGGKIINLASMMSYLGGINTAAYTASKSAVMGMTRLMASEWGSLGINVNAIAPGFIETEMTAVLSDAVREASVAQIPLGRFGKPEDIAKTAAFLASDDAGYITGQVIQVDGGMAI